jgi:hypothetical protein
MTHDRTSLLTGAAEGRVAIEASLPAGVPVNYGASLVPTRSAPLAQVNTS